LEVFVPGVVVVEVLILYLRIGIWGVEEVEEVEPLRLFGSPALERY
jgi:hypothetical protein